MKRAPRARLGLISKRHEKSGHVFYTVLHPDSREVVLLEPWELRVLGELDGHRDLAELAADAGRYEDGSRVSPADIQSLLVLLRSADILEEDEAARPAGPLPHEEPVVDLADPRRSAAREIVARLRAEGISYRADRPERRPSDLRTISGTGDDRTVHPSEADLALYFDAGIFCLNEGDLERAVAYFERVRQALPDNDRIRSIVHHIGEVMRERIVPVSARREGQALWAEFDRVIETFLAEGRCPYCSRPIRLVMGGTNTCEFCGVNFTAYVLEQTLSAQNRRRQEETE